MKLFSSLFQHDPILNREQLAKLLQTTPDALQKFEEAYRKEILNNPSMSDNLFEINAKQAVAMHGDNTLIKDENVQELISKIVEELLSETETYCCVKGNVQSHLPFALPPANHVHLSEISSLPKKLRPQLTGRYMTTDFPAGSSDATLYYLAGFMDESNPQKKRKLFYDQFRVGLDICDLDEILYRIIGTNPNSMGYWLPALVDACQTQSFFKIPDTTIIKVPLTLLQLTRLDYMSLTQTTLDIVNQFCEKAFKLDVNKDYFIKTGTYSSKFDFRNAHVHGAKEVRELGEYLLYIHFQALSHSHYDLSGRNQPQIYGMSTTNEWVVREFIEDVENNPCIYKGLPLRTEYRAFVDCDDDSVLGIHPYWDSKVMKHRFSAYSDADSPDQVHDYAIYCAHESTLKKRFNENKAKIVAELEDLVPRIDLSGQWSLDIMQNGNDFYLIDMAQAESSAFYTEVVPPELRNPSKENWIPKIC